MFSRDTFVRDKKYCLANLEKQDGSVVCKKPMTIIYPVRWEDAGLALLGDIVTVLGFYLVIVDNKYMVGSSLARHQLTPATISEIKLEGANFRRLNFDAGQVVIKTTQVVREDVLPYYVFHEFIELGKYPLEYMDYVDVVSTYNSAHRYPGEAVGATASVISAVCASICRDPDSPKEAFSTAIDDIMESKKRPLLAPFHEYQLGTSSTLSKIMGSYATDGLDSALVDEPNGDVEVVEAVLNS